MQRLIARLRRVRERPPSGSAAAPGAAGASQLRGKGRGGLHSAAASGDLAQLQRHWWWKRLRINGRDAKQQTPLHLACANGHADVVRFLAGKGCQLNPRDKFEKSPLMMAVEHQHKDCAAILLEHGAKPDLRGADGNTALHLAAVIPSKSLVDLLLEHNAHIDAQNELGYTPLTAAITKHHEEMVEFLLQKGATMHAKDKRGSTALMTAAFAGDVNTVRLLLQHGVDISHEEVLSQPAMSYIIARAYADMHNHPENNAGCERTGECNAGSKEGTAVLDISSSGNTANFPFHESALPGAGVLPTAGAEQEEDNDSPFHSEITQTDCEGPRKASAGVLPPAAAKHEACARPLAEERGHGVLPAAGAEQEEDDDSPFDSETDSEGPRKASAGVLPPAAAKHEACARPLAEERGHGVLPTAGAEQEEDDDSPFDSETDCEGPRKASAGVLPPAAAKHEACARPLAEERGHGVLPAAGAEQEEDDDSPFDSETDSEGPRKASAGVLPPAAAKHEACARPLAEERGHGVLPAAGAEQEEDDDSPFDSETDCEGPRKASAGVLPPAAAKHEACARPLAEERGHGVLPAAGAEQEEDDDSPFDSETDCEGPRKASAGVLPPAAAKHEACARPLAEERGHGVLPAAGAEQEEDDDSPFDSETDCEGPRKASAGVLPPAAAKHEACARPLAEERGDGVLPAAGAEQEEDDDSPFDSETDCEGPRKASAGVLPPAAAKHEACARPLAEERGHGVLPAAGAEQEEDDDSPFDSETDCEGPRKASAGVLPPAAAKHEACARPLAEERGHGVLPAAGAEQEEDDDSPFDSETDCEGPRKASAGVLPPAAAKHEACARPLAEERGHGVLPAAGAEQEEDDDSPFDSETDCEGPRKASAGVLPPAAAKHEACARPLAEERGHGVLPAAGAEQEEDDDSPFDSETDCEGPRKASAGVLPPAAAKHEACARPLAEERGHGVLPAAGAEQEEDDDSPFDSETDCEGPRKASAGVLPPAAAKHEACARPLAEERGHGVLPAAGAEQEEDDDSPFDSETDCEGPRKASAGVLPPAAAKHEACARPLAEERGHGVLPAAGAEQEEDDDISCLSTVSLMETEDLQLKKDASTQADYPGNSQRWVRQLQQKLADTLKKNSLAEASLEAKKRYSRDLQEQKLWLQKELDRSKAKLQELKERHIRTECYAKSLKNAIKNKERELTASRDLQGLLATSSGIAAIPELEERLQRLHVGKARLEATAQQQAKTIKALQKDLQASASAHNGLEDSITGFRATQTAEEHQHRQCGSENKEVKELAKLKRRSEVLLDEMRGRNIALEEERTRLKMLLEGSWTKLMAYVGRESQLSFRGEMKSNSSKVDNQVGKLRRKLQLNFQHG